MTTSIPTYPDLAGKVAVVTGGSGEIGGQTCRYFAANGMKVVVSGRDKDAIDEVVSDIRASGGEAVGVPADTLSSADLANLNESAERELGPVDVLCTFAGFEPGPSTMDQVTEQDWRAIIDGNLTGTFLTLKEFVGGMTERGSGSIITMSSAAGRLPGWSSYGYAAAKAGILQLTRRVAQDVGRHGVRVNALAPSAILTRKQEARIPAHVRDQVVKEQFVLGRWGTPADCANAALFLASEASSWITGQTTDIAGGKIMV
ncbi:SDR family NAD(P)-dependent oxidoreductase [Actinophytocola sp.]|uniref:SDR family NAD(P)-dependent oxidoreductase n=1 Tax=Actinophytocola sp. TaxID=1872138 RepID=UPI003D6BCC1F